MKRRQIFREQALNHFKQRRKQDVVSRVLAPQTFLFLWVFLFLAGIGGFFIGQISLPVYVQGTGVIPLMSQQNMEDTSRALVFLAPTERSSIHPGQPVQLQIDPAMKSMSGVVQTVSRDILAPQVLLQQYGLENWGKLPNPLPRFVTQPSLVVTVELSLALSREQYAGSIGNAKILIGTRSIIELF
jgi:hypothetical protein